MLSDKDILQYLQKFNVTEDTLDVSYLHDVSFKNKSAFYWINSLLPFNIIQHPKNVIFLENLGDNSPSILALIYYVIQNLESILDKITHVQMKQWIIPLVPYSHKLTQHQNINMILFNDLICKKTQEDENPPNIEILYNTLPLTKDRSALIIAKSLNLCPLRAYYPQDMEPYPNQRALLINILIKFDFYERNGGAIQLIKEFISKLPNCVELDILKEINQMLVLENSGNEGRLWMLMMKAYGKLSNIIPQKYETMLGTFEESIIPSLINEFNIKNLETYTEVDCEEIKHCNDIISPRTIFKVLSSYKTFYNNKTTSIETLKLCPIQVAYILRMFPYYNKSILSVDTGNIVVSKDDILSSIEETDKNIYLEDICNLVVFNGNYENFKNTISLMSFPYEDFSAYIEELHKNVSFKRTTIISEIMKQNTNINIDSLGMYNLMSKLSTEELSEIDTLDTFKNRKPALSAILDSIINQTQLYAGILDYTDLITTLSEMNKTDDTTDKIIIASKTNYNCITLLKYLTENSSKVNDINYLLLFSSAPADLKNLIYDKLPPFIEISSKYNATIEQKPINKIILNKDEMNQILLSKKTQYNCIALLDHFKSTKSSDILNIINQQKQHEIAEKLPDDSTSKKYNSQYSMEI